MTTTNSKIPYVGSGEDGARRSARIDREKADGLSWDDPRIEELTSSAEQWEEQAHQLMLLRVGDRPSLVDLQLAVGNEQWLAGIALLSLSPQLAASAAQYTEWSRDGGRYTYTGDGDDRVATFHPDASMDWAAWINDVDTQGRGWSMTR